MKASRIIAAVAAVGVTLTMAACGGGSNNNASSSAATSSASSSSASPTASPSPTLSGEITYVSWGGAGAEAAKKGWLDPFTAETGVVTKGDEPSDQAKVKAMVDAGNVTWDVFQYDPTAAAPECGTLYDKRPAGFDMSQVDPALVTDDCGIPVIKQTVALVYNADKFGANPPTSITDFMDTAKFPGKRIVFNYWAGSAEPMELAAGTPGDQLYPYNWDTLNSVKDKLGSDLVFQGTLDEQMQSQIDGSFAMCLCYLGRSAVAAQQGGKIGVVWGTVFSAWDAAYVVKGSKNPDAAWAFQQTIATSAGQNPFYQYVAYSPTTTGEPPAVPAEFEPYMAVYNADKITENTTWDVAWLGENSADIADKWTALTAS